MRKVLLIFSALADGDVEWLAQSGERIHVDAGTTLIPCDAMIENLYFVIDGRLAVKTRNGAQIAIMEAGEVIGEMSLVDPAPTAVSVEVVTDALLLRIADAKMRQKLAADHAFASRFYRALCVFLADRLHTNTRRMGYGTEESEGDKRDRDELPDELLDNVHLAGARFDRMLKRLAG